MQTQDFEHIRQQTAQAVREVLEAAHLSAGDIFVTRHDTQSMPNHMPSPMPFSVFSGYSAVSSKRYPMGIRAVRERFSMIRRLTGTMPSQDGCKRRKGRTYVRTEQRMGQCRPWACREVQLPLTRRMPSTRQYRRSRNWGLVTPRPCLSLGASTGLLFFTNWLRLGLVQRSQFVKGEDACMEGRRPACERILARHVR